MLEINKIHLGDCLELMKDIPDKSIDMILCDLPYGTTACKWDTIIPFEPLWEQYHRVIKNNGAIVLTASQPFTSVLVISNIKNFKYEWIWEKENSTGFVNANARPLKKHENIIIFSKGSANSTNKSMKYYPQNLLEINKIAKYGSRGGYLGERKSQKNIHLQKYTNYPTTILKFKRDKEKLHPTQKPVPLFEYLIRTYTNEGDLVLDNCIGSGTTAIACINTNRNFIGIEKDATYFEIANKRIEEHISK